MSFLDRLFPKAEDQAAINTPINPAPAPAAAVAPEPKPIPTPDPLDTLWAAPENTDPNKVAPLNFDIDASKLAEIAGKIDYSQAITPEIRQRIAAGGEDGVAATMEAINAANRLSFQQSAMATSKLIEAAITNTAATMDDKINAKIKLLGLNDALQQNNPAINNPRYAPIVAALKEQIITKYPNATQSEIAKMTTTYLERMAEDMNPALVKKANTNTQVGLGNLASLQPETDWLDWLNK